MLAEVKNHNGRPALYVDGKVCTSPIAMISTRTRKEENPIILNQKYFTDLGNSGIKIYLVSCNTEWAGDNSLELFDKEAKLIFEAVPDAYIIARFGLHPSPDWTRENPDECEIYGDGTKTPVHVWSESKELDLDGFYSPLSSVWRKDAGEKLISAWKKVMALPYADRIIGCMPTAGGTSEWYYIPPFFRADKKTTLGHSKAFKREFSEYLRETYKTDENLRKHWKIADATIDNPPIPDYEQFYFAERVDEEIGIRSTNMLSTAPMPEPCGNGTNCGSFINCDKNMPVYDFLRAWHLGTAKSQIYFAKLIKEITPDRIVGFCYGSQNNIDYVTSGTNGGTRLILESEYIDFIENPCVYQNRKIGGFASQRVVLDAFALHNKLYICQDDTRTHAENRYYREKFGVFDMTDTINVLKRDFGKCICEDMPHWWFDQLVGGKRFDFPEVIDLFKKQQEITDLAYSLDRAKKNDIALIFDEESIQTVSYQTTCEAVGRLRNYEIPRVGTGIDQYYHNDMANPDMPSYKLYIFVNTYVLTEEEKKVIHEKLRKDKAVAVWMYAPGFVRNNAEKKLSPSYISALTGINVEMICDCFDAAFRWDGAEHKISKDFDSRKLYGMFASRLENNWNLNVKMPYGHGKACENINFDTYLYPMFHVADEKAEILAKFANTGLSAVAIKECDGFTSIYYGSKYISHDVIRALAKFAGVNIYSDSDDVIYVGRNYITFHTTVAGEKTIKFPKPVTVTEVYENKCYGENVTEITFSAYTGETKMFRIE